MIQDDAQHASAVGDKEMVVVVFSMDFARCVCDFADHEEQVLPHLLLDVLRMSGRPIRKDAIQVFLNEFPAEGHDTGQQESENAAESLAAFERHGL